MDNNNQFAEIEYCIGSLFQRKGLATEATKAVIAISNIDKKTVGKPIGYMANCVHPTVLGKALSPSFNKTKLVKERFCGIQANTSPLSPEELDDCSDLKSSDSVNLANEMMKLDQYFTPKIFGGCCGTDDSHMEEIAKRIKNIRIFGGKESVRTKTSWHFAL
nr:homocysteine S-methyltransferase family protein [Clostridium sp. DL-VIII]